MAHWPDLQFSIFLTLSTCLLLSLALSNESISPCVISFCVIPPVGTCGGTDLLRNEHTFYAENPVWERHHTCFYHYFNYRDTDVQRDWHPWKAFYNACSACLPPVLSQGMNPEICYQAGLLIFSLDQRSLQERRAPVCLPGACLSVFAQWTRKKKSFKSRRAWRNLCKV